MHKKHLFIAVIAGACLLLDASAQRPQRERPDTRRELRPDCEPRLSAISTAPEPYGALERELPSLRVDLGLAPAQMERWGIFERDVRVAAELDRHRIRQMLPLRDKSQEPPATTALLSMLSDIDRRKAEATQALNQNLASLYAILDERQKRMLDRRVALSHSEPLGLGLSPGARRD